MLVVDTESMGCMHMAMSHRKRSLQINARLVHEPGVHTGSECVLTLGTVSDAHIIIRCQASYYSWYLIAAGLTGVNFN